MVKTTLKQPIQLIFHGIRFVSKHLELLEHRATTSAGKQVSILRGIVKKMSPFLPSWQFVQYLSYLDYFLIFALTRHECVTDIIICFSPILLFYFMYCLDISEWKAFLTKPTVCKMLMIDVN